MTNLATKFGRILLASLITGLAVWWVLLATFGIGSLFTITRLPGDSIAEQILSGVAGLLYIGLFGSLYAGGIGLSCGIACAPATLAIMGQIERQRLASGLVCSLAGAASAVISMLAAGCILAAITYARGKPEPFDSLPLLLMFSIGGPIAGYIYWRLARTELQKA